MSNAFADCSGEDEISDVLAAPRRAAAAFDLANTAAWALFSML